MNVIRVSDIEIDEAALKEIHVSEEYLARRQNTVQRNLKLAKISQPHAHIQEIDYSPSRRINKETIHQLATGTGKSYLTNALCRYVIEEGYTAR